MGQEVFVFTKEDKKNIVSWQSSYSVKIKLLDEQHMHLVKLTNRLFADCLSGREKSKVAFQETVRQAVDYVGYHFSTEEKLMERVNYPDIRTHKQEHADFVREVFIKLEEFNSGKLLVAPLNFVYFLRDWILNHIAVCDKKMGNYFLEMHRRGELHKITFKVQKDEAANRIHIK